MISPGAAFLLVTIYALAVLMSSGLVWSLWGSRGLLWAFSMGAVLGLAMSGYLMVTQ